MPEPPFDVAKAHRWFAIEFNNEAWDLVEKPDRTADESERMIHAAHAACHHWSQAGTPLNRQRALCLLATAYAVAGRPNEAAAWAGECVELSRRAGDGQSAFDRATAFGCAARAAASLGRDAEARDLRATASESAALLDADDRAVFDRLYPGF